MLCTGGRSYRDGECSENVGLELPHVYVQIWTAKRDGTELFISWVTSKLIRSYLPTAYARRRRRSRFGHTHTHRHHREFFNTAEFLR